ncbi:flavoprotein NADH-dependent oxidoreductase [Mycena filopes]|nr:flavoprotein NADH-dependent oxidoreductase [Mycena filopes]
MAAMFTPLKVGSFTIPNRIGMASMTRNRALPETKVPSDLVLEYYLQRARGNPGILVNEGTLITRQGTEWPNAPGMWNQEQIDGWKRVVDAVHTTETKIYCQLWHPGRCSHPDAPAQIAAGEPVYAPSAIPARVAEKFRFLPGNPGYATPTEIEDPMILVAQYKQAAVNAKKAGFDGIEVHAANGYLIHQFLDLTSNQRTDQWGGSAENRARFGLEVLKAVIEVFGADVGVKLTPAGGINDMGMPLDDTLATFNYFISEADRLGASYIALTRYVPFLDMLIDGKSRATHFDVISTFRPVIKSAKYFANGAYTPAEAEEIISSGMVDAVFFGVPWIAHPDFAKRVQHGKPVDSIADPTLFYAHPDAAPQLGFTDYPAARYE